MPADNDAGNGASSSEADAGDGDIDVVDESVSLEEREQPPSSFCSEGGEGINVFFPRQTM